MKISPLAVIGIFVLIGSFTSGCVPADLKGGTRIILEAESAADEALDTGNTERIVEIISNRLSSGGEERAVVKAGGKRQIKVLLPPRSDLPRATGLITATGRLGFRLVGEQQELEKALHGDIPPGSEILHGRVNDEPYLTQAEAFAFDSHIAKASVDLSDPRQGPAVIIELDGDGAKRFGKITGENVGRRLAIVFDGRVYSAPVIREKIPGGRVRISSGKLTVQEATDLAAILRSGPLPVPVSVAKSQPL